MSKIDNVTSAVDHVVWALRENELDAVTGGAVNAFMTFFDRADGESIRRATISSAISEVMKNFGGALTTAARAG
jgi:hypothetical protein